MLGRLLGKIFTTVQSARADDPHILPVLTADQLYTRLELHNRLRSIRRKVGIDPKRYEYMYAAPIAKYCELVQLLPASQAYHHAYHGGLIVHTLSVVENAIYERNRYELPLASEPEVIEAQKNLWTYAVFVAALLHDIGKVMTMVYFIDRDGQQRIINPAAGSLLQQGVKTYALQFRETRHYRLHERLGLLFMAQLLDAISMDFLTRDLDIFGEVLGYINADEAAWGSVGAIVRTADQMSVEADLRIATQTGRTRQFTGAATTLENFGERLMRTLRLLVEQRQLPVNRPGATLFTSDDRVYVYAVAKTLADKLRDAMKSLGATDVPTENTRIFDELQQNGLLVPTASGQAIHNIHVSIPDAHFSQDFTTLKFETRKVFSTASMPQALAGQVSEGSKPHPAEHKTAGKSPAANKAGTTPPATEQDPQALKQEDAITALQSAETVTNTLQQDTSPELLPDENEQLEQDARLSLQQEDADASPALPMVMEEATPLQQVPDMSLLQQVQVSTVAGEVKPANQVNTDQGAESPEATVAAWWAWLWQQIEAKNLVVNRSGSQAYIVEHDGKRCLAIVSPKTFADFAVAVGNYPASEGPLNREAMVAAAGPVQSAIHKMHVNIPFGGKQIHYRKPKSAQSAKARLSLYFFELSKIEHKGLREFLDKCEVTDLLI